MNTKTEKKYPKLTSFACFMVARFTDLIVVTFVHLKLPILEIVVVLLERTVRNDCISQRVQKLAKFCNLGTLWVSNGMTTQQIEVDWIAAIRNFWPLGWRQVLHRLSCIQVGRFGAEQFVVARVDGNTLGLFMMEARVIEIF